MNLSKIYLKKAAQIRYLLEVINFGNGKLILQIKIQVEICYKVFTASVEINRLILLY